uniref:EamA domain-containing protein n=1 Tax=Fagus sylvatica TaxID=28930 RepID=A0A2N9E1F5_FAGSY
MNWCNLKSCWRSHETWQTVYLLFLGQVVSFVLALSSFTSSLIATLGVDAPLTQTLFPYFFLGFVYGIVLLYRPVLYIALIAQPCSGETETVSWYWYLLLGFVDVQGNYLVNKAFQFSSITSVTLLDCWTIPWVIILTWIFLATRYSLWQLFGAALCIVGLGLVFLSDAGVGGGDGSKPLLGDVLVVAGTVFYAMSNVGEILAFVGYGLSTFMLYSLAPFVLKVEKNHVPVSAVEDGNSNAQYQVLTGENEASRNESFVS